MVNVTNLSFNDVSYPLPPRMADANKGMFGHVVVVGGDYGMAGAVRIAGEGALRVGAGIVTVLTRPLHVSAIVSTRPELLCYGVDKDFIPATILKRATFIILGPGLGKSEWSKWLFSEVINLPVPKLIDADGLNLLAADKSISKFSCTNLILTPHPGEAGRLLEVNTQTIQNSRVSAVQKLNNKYGAVIVLKGQGSLITADGKNIIKSTIGNPGMATGGMGDLLSGIIAGFAAQGLDLLAAATYGVLLHAHAGDTAIAKRQSTSVLATDLFDFI